MVNMLPDTESPYEQFVAAVNRKRKGPERDTLQELLPLIQDIFGEYRQRYDENRLELIEPNRNLDENKDCLVGLYSSKCKLITDFRTRFFNRNQQTYYNVCPYCTINTANTTDHILPKERFPEYAVHVLNLMPCCSQCNSLKGEKVVNGDGERVFLNFYNDRLFSEQFLFLHFDYRDGSLNLHYYLQKPETMNEESFSLISRHFNKLKLLSGEEVGIFDSRAISNLTDLTNDYLKENFQSEEDYCSFVRLQLNWCDSVRDSYGINHWRVVLKKSAAESQAFKDYIFNKLSNLS